MKIIFADDHTLFRESLRHVLEQLADGVALLEAGNHQGMMALADGHPDADLALVDLGMPGQDGLAAVAALAAKHPTLPVVVLSGNDDPDCMDRALRSGASGFIPKSETTAVMLSALRLILSGGIYVPPALMQHGRPSSALPNGSGLTPRQRDVLQGLNEGHSNKEIGRRLQMSEATVKAHITAIFRALGVSNRLQAVRVADRLRLLVRNDGRAG